MNGRDARMGYKYIWREFIETQVSKGVKQWMCAVYSLV